MRKMALLTSVSNAPDGRPWLCIWRRLIDSQTRRRSPPFSPCAGNYLSSARSEFWRQNSCGCPSGRRTHSACSVGENTCPRSDTCRCRPAYQHTGTCSRAACCPDVGSDPWRGMRKSSGWVRPTSSGLTSLDNGDWGLRKEGEKTTQKQWSVFKAALAAYRQGSRDTIWLMNIHESLSRAISRWVKLIALTACLHVLSALPAKGCVKCATNVTTLPSWWRMTV